MESQPRKLASIQKIVSIVPIENADKIVCATVLGWKCVTQKSNNFKPGDLVVYFEIDSLVPYTPWSSFLWEPGKTEGKKKIKTIRLRGQVSQGLILPVNDVLDTGYCGSEECPIIMVPGGSISLEEGVDLTELLGIEKWEPHVPAQLQGICKSTFPSWIPKTDETRIQAWPWILNELRGKVVVGTEKLDGSSMTVFVKNEEFGVCSRNMELVESEGNSFWSVARALDLEKKLKSLNRNISFQGELIGPGVQGNKYKLSALTMRVFNIFDIDKFEHLDQKELEELCKQLDIPIAPVVALVELEDKVDVDWLVALTSSMKSNLNSDVLREGIVFRPLIKVVHPKYGRVSFKVINPEFLLKYGE